MDDDSAAMTRGEKLLAALALVGVGGLVVLMLAWSNGSLSATQPFDAETWRQADGAWISLQPSERKTMIDDLLDSRLLIGLREAEVIALLGPGRVSRHGRQQHMTWLLGPLSFVLGVDDRQYLGVALEDGVVFEAFVFAGI